MLSWVLPIGLTPFANLHHTFHRYCYLSYYECKGIAGGVAIGDTWPVPPCFEDKTTGRGREVEVASCPSSPSPLLSLWRSSATLARSVLLHDKPLRPTCAKQPQICDGKQSVGYLQHKRLPPSGVVADPNNYWWFNCWSIYW